MSILFGVMGVRMVMGRLVRLNELPNIGMFVGGYNDCNNGGNSW